MMLDLKDNLVLMGTQVQMVTWVSLVLRVREEQKDAKVQLVSPGSCQLVAIY